MTGVASCKAVILLGGPSRGTRFRPLSFNTPKPLFPIGGEPFIYHHLRQCAKIPGLKEVLLLGFYEANLFEGFMSQAESELGIKLRYLKESKALGTAGGLHHFRNEIMNDDPELIFVLQSDVYGDFRLSELLQVHTAHRAAGESTILGKKVNPTIASNFGNLAAGPDGKVLHYAEKPETFVSDIISCGVYAFHPSIFQRLAKAAERHSGRPQYERDPDSISLEAEVVAPLASSGHLRMVLTGGPWGQVKNAGSALPANATVLAMRSRGDQHLQSEGGNIQGRVSIHPSAKVHSTAKIGPNVTIGENVTVGEGARIKDAIVLDKTEILAHACVLNAVVGARSHIGVWTRVEGSDTPSFEQTINAKANDPRLCILGDDVFVADEIIIRNCVVLPFKELKSNAFGEVIM